MNEDNADRPSDNASATPGAGRPSLAAAQLRRAAALSNSAVVARPATPDERELPALRELLDWSRDNGSRMGYFAALYFHTANAVQVGLAKGEFRDPRVLASVNDTFFSRYLAAFDAYRSGGTTSSAWEVSFRAADDDGLTVLQQLMLGMNAHINFDLAIAVSEAVAPADLDAFRPDFEHMNKLFSDLVDDVAANVAAVWQPLRFVNGLLGREEQIGVDLIMHVVRDEAWQHAVRLSGLDGDDRDHAIAELDERTTEIARLIQQPGWPATEFALDIRHEERGSVAQIIDDLLSR